MSSTARHIAAWVAGIALLLSALAPTLARAMAAWQGDKVAWTELCTSAGMVRIAVPLGEPSDEGSGNALVGTDCPYCQTHAGSFALPGAPRIVLPAAEPYRPLPELAYRSPRPLFAWAAAQPRAPPVFS